ncbi:MAG: FAD-dependent oxidoreductase [Gemmatimonadota bacterium]
MTKLVLVGGGHAHLFVLEALARRSVVASTILISPETTQTYSGMVPGFIEGRYVSREITIDLAALAGAAGAELVIGTARRVDRVGRTIELESGERIGYDVLSLAIGSSAAGLELPGVREHALLTKPIGRTERIVAALERGARETGAEPLRVVIVGGGAAGVELALAVRARLDWLGAQRSAVTLISEAHTVLSGRAPAAIAQALHALKQSDITVRTERTVEALGDRHLKLAGGGVTPADLVIWATGAAAPPIFRESGLPIDRDGFLLLDEHLRAEGAPDIFAAGDAATLRAHPATAKSGVYAVRQGAVLARNLARVCAAGVGTRGLETFHPQRRFLALLNTGDGRAIFSYGPFALTSRWAMRLKDRIDREFMQRFGGEAVAR